MSKILEKALKDALKEDKITMGTKQVLNSVKNSKLIVLSQSVGKEMFEKIQQVSPLARSVIEGDDSGNALVAKGRLLPIIS